MDIFERGDYRAFLAITGENIDTVLYAFPIFEDQSVSQVFDYYRYLYFPDSAKITYRALNRDDDAELGKVFADVSVGPDENYKISTIPPNKALWPQVVAQWEDQWVFDHVVSTTGKIPKRKVRTLIAGQHIQDEVSAAAKSEFNRQFWTLVSLGIIGLFVNRGLNPHD